MQATTNNEQKETTEISRSRKKRQPVSARRFEEVAVRQGSYCYWCGIKVVRESQIPPNNRLIKKQNTIIYYVGDELREEAIGTVDHLLRVADGGGNQLTNLVISCDSCNQEREQRTQAYGRPFARRRVPCAECGGRFFHPDWGCCSICGAVPRRSERSSKWMNHISKFLKLIERIRRRLVK